MQRRSFVIMAAVVTGLVLGVIVSPSVRGTIASAQTQPPATQPQSKFDGLRSLFLDKLAAALNIQRAALDAAITSAGTSTLDSAVQQGTLTQEQADAIKPRLQSGDVGPLFGGRGFGHRGPEVAGVRQTMLDAAAKTLNLTTDELIAQLRSGQTLAQLAQAHNTTEQAVKDAVLAAAKTQLDAAVKAGTVTQAQADAIYARLQQDGLKLGFPGGGRGHGRHGMPRGDNAPSQPATPQAPSSDSGL